MIENNAFYFLGGMLVLISTIQFVVGYYLGYRRAKREPTTLRGVRVCSIQEYAQEERR